MVGMQAAQTSAEMSDGLRPVNLRTDLGPLADLIELAFADTMDSSGRAAVREMRTLSRMGAGLNLLAGLNDLAQGMGMGYVWIADGRLVGNVSTYPAPNLTEMKDTWVIVNVATHPDYRKRGIANQLMQETMSMIRARGGKHAILQVDADNPTARSLYGRLGFVEERGWISWKRSGTSTRPQPVGQLNNIYITHRNGGEWRSEYALAQQVRPAYMGGLGWLRPLAPSYFRAPLWKQLVDWFSLRNLERLIIRSADDRSILASLWIESGFTSSSTQLTLMIHPDFEGLYDDALLSTAVRRFGGSSLTLEHPSDRLATNALLRRYGFNVRRDVIHMRWDV